MKALLTNNDGYMILLDHCGCYFSVQLPTSSADDDIQMSVEVSHNLDEISVRLSNYTVFFTSTCSLSSHSFGFLLVIFILY